MSTYEVLSLVISSISVVVSPIVAIYIYIKSQKKILKTEEKLDKKINEKAIIEKYLKKSDEIPSSSTSPFSLYMNYEGIVYRKLKNKYTNIKREVVHSTVGEKLIFDYMLNKGDETRIFEVKYSSNSNQIVFKNGIRTIENFRIKLIDDDFSYTLITNRKPNKESLKELNKYNIEHMYVPYK